MNLNATSIKIYDLSTLSSISIWSRSIMNSILKWTLSNDTVSERLLKNRSKIYFKCTTSISLSDSPKILQILTSFPSFSNKIFFPKYTSSKLLLILLLIFKLQLLTSTPGNLQTATAYTRFKNTQPYFLITPFANFSPAVWATFT